MNSLARRKERMKLFNTSIPNSNLIHDLFLSFQIPENLLLNLKNSVIAYICRAIDSDIEFDESKFVSLVENNRQNRTNITPNGAVVPKKEFQLEFNFFIRSWCEILKFILSKNDKLLSKIRVTPNIRIKFSKELEDNVGRDLDTSLPHSDAWVEGAWGLNCHVPLFGDCEKNYLAFFEYKNEKDFSDDFLKLSENYKEMQWVLKEYEPSKFKPIKNSINISDYALIHKTNREDKCGTRISIDTTVYVGDEAIDKDREQEYLSFIPEIGNDYYFKCHRSVKDDLSSQKKRAFQHYTTGNLELIKI